LEHFLVFTIAYNISIIDALIAVNSYILRF
jgi:hypothetical protein